MVATRRGVRVSNPPETNSEERPEVQATPSTARRTRRTVKADSPTQHTLLETCCHLEEGAPESPSTIRRRCTRASRLHSPEQPSTPLGSTHEADVSDVESCCSAVSNLELPRTRQPRVLVQEEEDVSEVESCCSAVSASKLGPSTRRSTRRKTAPGASDPTEAADVKLDPVLETESSASQRVTRSQRKPARASSPSKLLLDESEISDADSCVSSISAVDVSKSSTRRSTRTRRQNLSIPFRLDEPAEGSRSPAPTSRRTRSTRGKATASADASEPPSCDSEGFESGPTYSHTTPRQGRTRSGAPRALDSESDLTDQHSPIGPARGRGTPCSSRTGSGSSGRGGPTTRRTARDCVVVEEKKAEPAKEEINSAVVEEKEVEPVEEEKDCDVAEEMEAEPAEEEKDCAVVEEKEAELAEEEKENTVVEENEAELVEEERSFNESRLEDTVTAEDADCTLVEEETPPVSEEQAATVTDLPSGDAKTEEIIIISEDNSNASLALSDGPCSTAEAVDETAVTSSDQQEEPPAEDPAASEMEEETVSPSQPAETSSSVTVTFEQKEEKKKEDIVNEEEKEEEEEAVEEVSPNVEQEEEAKGDAQQVVELQAEETPSQQSEPEPQPRKTISLLDSSDEEEEEDDDEEEGVVEVSEEEENAGPSKRPEVAAAAAESVEGLFMIDTRPGLEADEHYYKEGPAEEEEEPSTSRAEEQDEEDEEFVDEEGSDDEEDEDEKVLFSTRNSQMPEWSTRIDPGLSVKELGGLYISFDGNKPKSTQQLKGKNYLDEMMKKSVVIPDFHKKGAVPANSESKKALKRKRREEREKTTGDGWFNMKAPEVTQELKGDLQVLKMRGSLDSKRFYKKNDRDGFPKYFQVGTVVDSPVDFYHSRIPKKDRKRTMVEELLADAEFRQNNKRKYKNIMAEKAAQTAGRKKKNKFHRK